MRDKTYKAGKTFGILPILIQKAIKKSGLRIWVVSCTYNHLQNGAIADFKRIMQETNRWNEECWHDTKHTYTFYNKSYITFQATDQGKARGPRRDILYINEANVGINFETYLALEERTFEEIWIDFNPTNEFWAHTEVLKDDDAEFLRLTYKDNEGLHENIVKKMQQLREKAELSSYWANRWKVYGLGEIGKLEGVVFENVESIKNVPSDAKLIGYGMDFGFSNDSTTLIAVYEWNDFIILDQLIYRTGMTPSDIAKELKELNISVNSEIYADGSRPETIEEIRRYGFKIKRADKGKGSIIYGISLMQEKNLLVTERSKETQEEFDKYAWAKDKDGVALNEPIDKYNHSIDAIRYLFIMKLNNKKPYTAPFNFGR